MKRKFEEIITYMFVCVYHWILNDFPDVGGFVIWMYC